MNDGAPTITGEKIEKLTALLEQFQEKCEAVFRPELRKNKGIDRFTVSVKL